MPDLGSALHKNVDVTFFTILYFYFTSFLLPLLNHLVTRTYGYTHNCLMTHPFFLSMTPLSLSLTHLLLLDMTHMFMTHHPGVWASSYCYELFFFFDMCLPCFSLLFFIYDQHAFTLRQTCLYLCSPYFYIVFYMCLPRG